MEHQAYRCCLPTLAGFAGNHCIGPGLRRRPAVCSPTSPPRRGIRPSYSGLLVQGTATSPSSTTKKLEPMTPKSFGTTCSEHAGAFGAALPRKIWSQRSESNRRPAVYETAALPAELRWRNLRQALCHVCAPAQANRRGHAFLHDSPGRLCYGCRNRIRLVLGRFFCCLDSVR